MPVSVLDSWDPARGGAETKDDDGLDEMQANLRTWYGEYMRGVLLRGSRTTYDRIVRHLVGGGRRRGTMMAAAK